MFRALIEKKYSRKKNYKIVFSDKKKLVLGWLIYVSHHVSNINMALMLAFPMEDLTTLRKVVEAIITKIAVVEQGVANVRVNPTFSLNHYHTMFGFYRLLEDNVPSYNEIQGFLDIGNNRNWFQEVLANRNILTYIYADEDNSLDSSESSTPLSRSPNASDQPDSTSTSGNTNTSSSSGNTNTYHLTLNSTPLNTPFSKLT